MTVAALDVCWLRVTKPKHDVHSHTRWPSTSRRWRLGFCFRRDAIIE